MDHLQHFRLQRRGLGLLLACKHRHPLTHSLFCQYPHASKMRCAVKVVAESASCSSCIWGRRRSFALQSRKGLGSSDPAADLHCPDPSTCHGTPKSLVMTPGLLHRLGQRGPEDRIPDHGFRLQQHGWPRHDVRLPGPGRHQQSGRWQC